MSDKPLGVMSNAELRAEIKTLDSKVTCIQRSKDHHKQRATLSALQSRMHAAQALLKRREIEEKRARYNHAITPTATA